MCRPLNDQSERSNRYKASPAAKSIWPTMQSRRPAVPHEKKYVSMRDAVMWCHNKCKCFSINLSIISKKFCIWRQYTHEQFCFDVEEKRSQQNKSHLNIMLLNMYGNNGNGGVICKRYVILLYHNDVYFFNRRYINADIGIYQWSRTKRRLNGVFVKNHNGVQSPYI